MEKTNTETTIETPQRPQFLTVLCMLTFIGVGIGIIGSIIGWWGMRYLATMIEQNGNGLEGMPGMNSDKIAETMTMFQYSDVLITTGLLGCLICLVGALQMWKLKKIGFFIYAIGEIAPPTINIALLNSAAFSGWSVAGYIFPILFLFLYNMNFKHLK